MYVHVNHSYGFNKVISGEFHMHADHNGTMQHLRQLRMEILLLSLGIQSDIWQ